MSANRGWDNALVRWCHSTRKQPLVCDAAMSPLGQLGSSNTASNQTLSVAGRLSLAQEDGLPSCPRNGAMLNP